MNRLLSLTCTLLCCWLASADLTLEILDSNFANQAGARWYERHSYLSIKLIIFLVWTVLPAHSILSKVKKEMSPDRWPPNFARRDGNAEMGYIYARWW
jgi:hypothetical protein